MCGASHQISSQVSLLAHQGLPAGSRQSKGPWCCNSTLTPTKHIHEIIKKAHQKIVMFRMCFSSFNNDKITILYKSLITPALECTSTVWSSYIKENINLLEDAQRRCFCLCKKDIQIESLQERRLRLKTDLVDAYEFINGLNRLQLTSFSLSPTHNETGIQKRFCQAYQNKVGWPLFHKQSGQILE